jgi:cytoskeletal protein RodZ
MVKKVEQKAFLSELTPGARLKKAREEQKITPEIVADRLKINRQKIIDLEEDRYRDSRVDVYFQGYLRHYASMLGLDAAGLFEDLDHMGFDVVDTVTVEFKTMPATMKFKLPPMVIKQSAWMSSSCLIAAAVICLVLLLLWGFSGSFGAKSAQHSSTTVLKLSKTDAGLKAKSTSVKQDIPLPGPEY